MAESALTLRDIGQYGNNRYNSNEKFYETSTSPSPSSLVASPTLHYTYHNQHEYVNIDEPLSIYQEKTRSEFQLKRTESQYSTPQSLKMLKLTRSSSNCTPGLLQTTPIKNETNIISNKQSTPPYTAEIILNNKHYLHSDQNDSKIITSTRQLRNPLKCKPFQSDLSITNGNGSQTSRIKSLTSSQEKKSKEFWLEYGCI